MIMVVETTVATNTTGIFPNLSVAGRYTVTATDAKGCSLTSAAMAIDALNPPLNPTFVERKISCKATELTSDVTVSVTAGTGTNPLKYEITAPAAATSNISGASSGVFKGLSAGASGTTYTFKVTDFNNCFVTGVYTVKPVVPIIVKATLVNNVKCFDDLNGAVNYTISGLGNNVNYSYSIDGGAAVLGATPATPIATTFVVNSTGLAAGNHSLVITDLGSTCTGTNIPINVAAPVQLVVNAPTITPITCSKNAKAVINSVGGWGSNSYTVTGTTPVVAAVTQSTATFTNLTAGDYSASVTDLNGCTDSIAFTIAPVVAVVASIGTSDFCYDSVNKATLVVSPITQTNYDYSINSGGTQTNGTFANLTPGNYSIRVTDTSTSCFVDLSATIANQVSANTAITKNLDCTASPNATIKVTVGNGYPNYSYRVNTNGGGYGGAPISLGAGVTTFNYTTTTGAAAATYDFEITDAKGCVVIVTQNISARVSPTATTTPTNPTCFGGSNGSVLINASLGLAPYTYEVSTDGSTFAPMASNLYSGATAGDYLFRVTDFKSCTFITPKITLGQPSKITANASATTLTCNTSNVQQAAVITVSASNGTPFAGPNFYRYSYNGAADVTSNTFSTNSASTVTIDVKDANGCSVNVPSVIIAALNPPTAIGFTQVNPITCGATTSDVKLTVTAGGVAPFKYEMLTPTAINNGAVDTFTALLPVTYTFKVTDNNNCTVTDTYKVLPVKPITVSGSLVANVICNGNSDGKIQFTIGGDTAGYGVTLTNSLGVTIAAVPTITPSGTSFVLDYIGLPAETYTLTVTSPTACTVTANVKVNEPTVVTITGTTATKVFCTKPISIITVTATGGTSPLAYAVVKHFVVPVPPLPGDYQSSNVFNKDTSLASNGLDYDVYVKDKNGCPANMGTVTVVSDPVPAVTAVGAGCLGTGYTITATPVPAVGLITPLSYSLNGGGFGLSNTFTITTANNYTVTIKDGNGCTASSNVVTVASKLTLSGILDKDITCAFTAPFATNDAQITLTAGGGTGSYTYTSIPATGTFVGNVFTTNNAGSYTFSITDASGCSIATTVGIPVTIPEKPVIEDTVLPSPTGVTQTGSINCNGEATAAIAIAINNTKGVAPFVFKVERMTPTYNNYGTQTSGLTAGDYTVTVTDAKGCTDTENITITEPTTIVVLHHELPITCGALGVSKGSIIIDKITDGISAIGGTGGTGPYNYFVTGVNGYSQSELNNTGTTSTTFNVVDFGLYQINVVDANGCSKIIQNVLVASPPDDLDINVISPPADCSTPGSATVSIGALSSITGTGPFYFRIYTGPGVVYNALDPTWIPEVPLLSKQTTFTNLIPGVKYTFTVYDADILHGGTGSGCYYYETATLPIPTNSLITVNPLVASNITCKGAANGNVTFTINHPYGVATPVTYQIYNSQTASAVGAIVSDIVPASGILVVNNFGVLPFGNYFVLVKEDVGAIHAGCSFATVPFDITEAAFDLTINATISKQPNTCNLTAGIITANASGGKVVLADPTDLTIIPIPYLYQITTINVQPAVADLNWNASNTFTGLAASTYYIWVKDAYNCIKMVSKTLINDLPPTITPQTPPCFVAGMNINLDISTFSAFTIGSPTYSINGTSFQASPNFTISAPGSYTLAIKDGNGCIASTIPYVVRDEIVSGLSITKQLDCTASQDATIHGDVAGGFGSGTYSYTVKIGSAAFGASVPIVGTTFDYSAATSDTYTFVITDGTCSVTEVIDVDAKVPTVFTTAVVDVKCFADNTGSISVDVTSGEGPFEYKLTGGPVSYPVYQDSNQFDLLTAATTYIVTVRSKINLCEYANLPITVGEPLLALAVDTPTIIKLSCGTGNVPQSATVTLNGTAGTGTGAFEYSFNGSGYSAVNVFTVIDDGTTQNIPYKVRDANNCEITGSVVIDKLDPPVFNLPAFTQSTVTCLAPTSNVTVASTNGVGTLTYETIAPSPLPLANNTTGNFANLAPGDYVFRVTDTNGCTDQVSYKVIDVTKIDLQVASQTDVICDASATGTAIFAVTGFGTGVGTYSCTVNGAAFPLVLPNVNTSPTISLTGLAANSYLVRVTDDETGCFSEQTVVIKNPTLPLSRTLVVTPLTCASNGAVTIAGAGGWGNYTYTLTPPVGPIVTNTTGVFDNLSDITPAYTIMVTDANGCNTTPDNFTLLAPVNPTATIDLTSDYCYDGTNGATLVVNAASGSTFVVTPFEYSIDNGATFQLSNTFNNLSPGSYDVVVKDAFGCKSLVPVNTVIKSQLFATAVSTKEIFCGPIDGTIKITTMGGYGPYTYKVSTDNGVTFPGVATAFTNPTDTDYSVPAAASYVFEITDSKGCVFVTTPPVVMAPPTPVALLVTDIAITAVDCTTLPLQGTNNNGTIKVNLRPVNDNPDYTFALSGTAIRPAQPSNIFTGLTPGNYDVTVTSGRDCPATVNVTIANPIAVSVTATVTAFSCAVDPTKTTAVVAGGGGTGTYSFSKDGINYFTSNTLPVADNKYTFDLDDTGSIQNPTYYVKDSNGCIEQTVALSIIVNPLPKLISATAARSLLAGSQIDCVNGKEEIQIDVVGGSVPSNFKYEVSIDGAIYTVLSASAGTPFTYSALLAAGKNYQFRITDNVTGCSILSNVYDVPLFNTINVVASTAANAKCNTDTNGAIEINVTGYSGTYNYEILKGGVPLVPALTGSGDSSITSSLVLPHGLGAGTDYTVLVKETSAYPKCTTISNVVIITEPAALDLTNLIVNVKNQNCNTLGAVLTVDDTTIVGGTRGYTYAFVFNGTGTVPPMGNFKPSKTATFATTQIAPSTDTVEVWVKDANGCYSFITKPISLDPVPTVTASVASQCAFATGYTINALGAGGVGLLEYSLDGNSFGTSSSLSVTSPGDYNVFVRDANGCISQTATQVTIFEPLQLLAEITTLSTCLDADGVVTLTASGGFIPANYEYSKDGISYGSSNVFNVLAASVTPYTFHVRNLASVPVCDKSVNVTMFMPNTAIAFVLDPTPVTCNGGNDGTITANMAPSTLTVNNNPIYTYALTGTTVGGVAVTIPATVAPLQTSPLFSGLAAGRYTVTVTSGRGCPVSQTIDVIQPAVITVPAPTVLEFGCTSGNTGNLATITVAGITGGTTPYLNYEFIKVVGTTNTVVQFGNSNVYTEANLSGGSYEVNVYDSKGCIGTSTTAIDIAPYIQLDKVNVNVTRPITCNPTTEDIAVSVTPIGGTPSNLAFTVKDVIYDNSVTPPTAIKGTAYSFPPVSVLGGVATFTNLPVGNYEITVRNLDTNCEIIGVHYVYEPNTFDLTIDNIVDVTCLNGTNGSANITFVDRVITTTPLNPDQAGSFNYTIVDALGNTLPGGSSATAGPITLTGLAAGTFMITASLSGTPFCTISKNFTITGPTAALTALETHSVITCVSADSGTISASATGGWPGAYEFELVGPVNVAYSANSNFTNLTAGNYTINVRDAKGCVDTKLLTLNDPTPIAFTAAPSTLLLTCNGDTSASITVGVPTGGQGSNYLYTLNKTSVAPVISSGPQNSNVFANLGAGTYTITVSDGWGCSTTSAVITIAEPNVVVASLVKTSTQTCTVQATLTLSATGGTGLYSYSTTPNFAVVAGPFATSITFSVPVGTYRYYVRDANGCISVVSNDIQIDPLPTLNVAVDIVNSKINCKGDSTGVIIASATGGLGNYVYTLLNGAGLPLAFVPTQLTAGNFTQLPAGAYIVHVNSGDCQVNSVVVTIQEPLTSLKFTSSKTDVKCSGNGDGSITVNGFDGSGIIKYSITPRSDKFLDTGLFTGLKPGLYTVIIQDENGCYLLKDVTIAEPLPIDAKVDPLSIKQELCAGEKTREFGIVISPGSGTAPYSTSLDDPKGTYVLGQVLFTGLSGGNHTIYIKDANSCTYELPVALNPSVILNPTADVSNECVNDLPANKVIVGIDLSNNAADVTYSLDASGMEQNSNVFNNLTPGDHYIMVHHKNDCDDATPVFTIDKIDPLAITLDLGGLNEIVATVTGGSSVYQFTVNGVSIGSNNKYIYFKSGNYTVTVTDSNGCVAAATKYFEFIDIFIPPIFTPTGDGIYDTWKPTNTENYPDIKFIVYDRYGRVVGTFGSGQSWDGKYNGTELPMGDYWYVVKLRHNQDDREFMGHVTLYR